MIQVFSRGKGCINWENNTAKNKDQSLMMETILICSFLFLLPESAFHSDEELESAFLPA